MEEIKWIDRLTRALIIDVMTYNANSNLFSRVRVLMEQSAIGTFFIRSQTRSIVLYNYVGTAGMIILLMQVAWLTVMTYMTMKTIQGLITQKLRYFSSNYWNISRTLGLSIAAVAAMTYIVKVIYSMKVVEEFKNNLGKIIQNY